MQICTDRNCFWVFAQAPTTFHPCTETTLIIKWFDSLAVTNTKKPTLAWCIWGRHCYEKINWRHYSNFLTIEFILNFKALPPLWALNMSYPSIMLTSSLLQSVIRSIPHLKPHTIIIDAASTRVITKSYTGNLSMYMAVSWSINYEPHLKMICERKPPGSISWAADWINLN